MIDGNLDYGEYALTGAQLLTIPAFTPDGVVSALPPPAQLLERPSPLGGVKRVAMTDVANNAYHPYGGKRAKVAAVIPAGPVPLPPLPPLPAPPPPAPPLVRSVGVMDVGQGGCQLLFGVQGLNPEPLTYFDVGLPLWFYIASAPNAIRPGQPGYVGPILQNANNNLSVVLSHWDWDHWRLARAAGVAAGMHNLPWTYFPQPVGPVTAAFIATLGAPAPYGGAPFTWTANYTIYRCYPPVGAVPAVIMNNSGLGMAVMTCLPIGDPIHHQILMPGDANVNSMTALMPFFPNTTGLVAVHHGSNANNATTVLPPQAFGYANQGRLAYSYGVRQNAAGAWVHCYQFPVPAAVVAYAAAGWGVAPLQHRSTAEGAALNGPMPPVNRGNIRMGDNTPLGAPFAGTAFGNYPNLLQ